MDGDLDALEAYVAAMMARLDEGGRRRMARRIGTDLRRSQGQRIGRQENPDGSAYTPRKSPKRARRGKIRRKATPGMFGKLRTPRYIRLEADPDQVRLSFAGAAARIAEVHHWGLRDKVTRNAGGPEASYPARRLLGLTEDERGHIMDIALEQLGGG